MIVAAEHKNVGIKVIHVIISTHENNRICFQIKVQCFDDLMWKEESASSFISILIWSTSLHSLICMMNTESHSFYIECWFMYRQWAGWALNARLKFWLNQYFDVREMVVDNVIKESKDFFMKALIMKALMYHAGKDVLLCTLCAQEYMHCYLLP